MTKQSASAELTKTKYVEYDNNRIELTKDVNNVFVVRTKEEGSVICVNYKDGTSEAYPSNDELVCGWVDVEGE